MRSPTGFYPWLILAVLFLNFFIFMVSFGVMPPLFTEIEKQIPMSMAQMGTIMAMFSLASIFFAPLGGVLGDKIGCRWAYGVGVIIMAISGGARGLVYGPWQMYACMFFMGAGGGVTGAVFPKAVGNWFPPHKLGMANGIVNAAFGVGGAVAMATAASILSPAFGGWRYTMLVLGGISLFFAIIWVFIYKEPKSSFNDTRLAPDSILSSLRSVLKIREVVLLGVFLGLALAGAIANTSLLPLMLERRGMERTGELVSIMMAASVIFSIMGGLISDRVGKRKPFLIFPAITAGICISSFLFLKGFALIVALFVGGAALGFIIPIILTMAIEMKKVGAHAGTAIGVILMLGNAGGFIGPVISGMLMDKTGKMWAGFVFMAAVLIIAALFIIPVKDTGRNVNVEDG